MTTRRQVLCASLLVLVFSAGAPSDDKPAGKQTDKSPQKNNTENKAAEKQPDKNVAAVSQALAALAKVLNARDSQAIAEMFTPKGEFIDADGNVFDSHAAIAGEFKVLFEVNPQKNSVGLTFDEIREISPGILSVDCVATFSDAGKKDEARETVDVDFSALLVKQTNGNWLFASIRSEGESNVPTPHAQLKRLEWLIGEWVDESDDSTIHTTTRWSEDGQFLMTDFLIRAAGRKVMSGTQRIGWDGSLDKFKSWVFDSEGGHAEGIWTEIDNRWVVNATGVRPDGAACSATQIYESQGPDSYLFTVTDRIVGDKVAPDFTSHIVKKPPEPDATTTEAAPPRKK